MFADIYRESLEGAVRREGPTQVLIDLRDAVVHVGRELDPAAHRECLHMVAALSQLIVRAKHNAILANGLNQRLQTDEPKAA